MTSPSQPAGISPQHKFFHSFAGGVHHGHKGKGHHGGPPPMLQVTQDLIAAGGKPTGSAETDALALQALQSQKLQLNPSQGSAPGSLNLLG